MTTGRTIGDGSAIVPLFFLIATASAAPVRASSLRPFPQGWRTRRAFRRAPSQERDRLTMKAKPKKQSPKPVAKPTNLPTFIYHYCSLSSFEGIVKNQTLWFHPVSTMNDSMEFTWFNRLVHKRVLRILKKDAEGAGKFASYQIHALIRLEDYLRKTLQGPMDPYCICLSQEPDDLYQWRSYSDDGRGFAIGFDTSLIKDDWFPDMFDKGIGGNVIGKPRRMLGQVSYHLKSQTKLADKVIDEYIQRANQFRDAEPSLMHHFAATAARSRTSFHSLQESQVQGRTRMAIRRSKIVCSGRSGVLEG